MNNLSDEEIEIITFILNNYPREMALKFKEQIVENSQEWFIKLLPITQFYKSLRDKIYEIQAKYVFENNEYMLVRKKWTANEYIEKSIIK